MPFFYKPPLQTLSVYIGKSLHIQFNLLYGFENNSSLNWHWTKLNSNLDISKRVQLNTTEPNHSILQISEALESDAGLYICTASNQYGNKSEQIKIYVKNHLSFVIPLICLLFEIAAICLLVYIFKQNKNKLD